LRGREGRASGMADVRCAMGKVGAAGRKKKRGKG
jgi:hypothetical protein